MNLVVPKRLTIAYCRGARSAHASIRQLANCVTVDMQYYFLPLVKQRCVVIITVAAVCLSVMYLCPYVFTAIAFESLYKEILFFDLQRHLQGIQVKFVCEGHLVKVKVTGAIKARNSMFQRFKKISSCFCAERIFVDGSLLRSWICFAIVFCR